jgi:tRNA (guanine-N7-)-methyltransferase
MRAFHGEHLPKPPLQDNQVAKLRGWLGAVDLEIGAGAGLHAIRYCQLNPRRMLIAIEKTHTRFAKLARRLQNHRKIKCNDVPNLFAVHADAVNFVCHYLPNEALERVFILYPNPYPKAKQSNLRWHNRPFFGHLLGKMRTGATVTLATNSYPYILEAKTALIERWQLKLTQFTQIHISNIATQPRTHFEKKYLQRGEKCWNLVCRKVK